MYKTGLVDIRKVNDLPPETKKHYRPIPAEVVPSIGENHMMHLYEHPEHAGDITACFEKVPKKFRERLKVSAQAGTMCGWGVYFVEGLDMKKIWALSFFGLLSSMHFGIVWSAIGHYVHGWFAVANFTVAALAFALGSLTTALEPGRLELKAV